MLRRLKSPGNRRERGQALVEFTLVALLFFTLFFGIFDFVRLFQSWVTVQHAARESARYAITGQTTCDGGSITNRDACIVWTARKATTGIPGGGPNASSSVVGVSFTAWDYDGTGWLGAVAGDSGRSCDQLEVAVTYKHHFVTPLIEVVAPSGISLTGRQKMVNEPFGPCNPSDGTVGQGATGSGNPGPTATPGGAPTATPTLPPAATSTPVPTSTPLPTATNTPVPTATRTPTPAPTATPSENCTWINYRGNWYYICW